MDNPIMKYFEYKHLPPKLQEVSAPLCATAKLMQETLPDCPEKSAGLRKLLEAKDCFVRVALEPRPNVEDCNAPGPQIPEELQRLRACTIEVRSALGMKAEAPTSNPGQTAVTIRFIGDRCGNEEGPCRLMMIMPDGSCECRESPEGYKLEAMPEGGYFRSLKCRNYLCAITAEPTEDAHD